MTSEGVALHAYVLMSKPVYLLVSCQRVGRISRAIRQTDQRWLQAFNRRYRLTRGRPKSEG